MKDGFADIRFVYMLVSAPRSAILSMMSPVRQQVESEECTFSKAKCTFPISLYTGGAGVVGAGVVGAGVVGAGVVGAGVVGAGVVGAGVVVRGTRGLGQEGRGFRRRRCQD